MVYNLGSYVIEINMRTIYIASDHAGFKLKEEMRHFLVGEGYSIADLGPNREAPNDDYPDFIRPVAEHVAREEGAVGVVFGGSGEGEAIAANRVSGVRAVVWYGKNDRIITLSREHNDANILAIGARFVDTEEVKRAIILWLETPFSHEPRHQRRIDKIDNP